MTQDHSWVEEQVRAGIMSRADAETSPFRNVITRSIGAAPNAHPDFFVEPCRPGDVWVLCSDGLTGHVGDDEIFRIASRHAPSESTRQLVELANGRGGRDNITVFVISVRDLYVCDETATGETAVVENNAHHTSPTVAPNDATNGSGTQELNKPGWKRLFGR